MSCLNTPSLYLSTSIPQHKTMFKKNLNNSKLTFPQDKLINFEETTHTYTVKGIGTMTPVSTVISKFFKEFDAIYWSMKKCNNNAVEAARLRETWQAKGAVASQAGTFMHQQIENFLNTGNEPDNMICATIYKGTYIQQQINVDITTEWQFFKAFNNNTRYTPFRTEWCVYDPDVRMAGTIDLLCSCGDGTYEIYDWKRSNKINPLEQTRWCGINGMEHICDTSYNHYCLQQNLYRYMLERHYGMTISRMNLVVLHPELDNYRIVPIKRMDKEVGIILKFLATTY